MRQRRALAGLPYPMLRDAVLAHPTMAEGLDPLFSNVPGERPSAGSDFWPVVTWCALAVWGQGGFPPEHFQGLEGASVPTSAFTAWSAAR